MHFIELDPPYRQIFINDKCEFWFYNEFFEKITLPEQELAVYDPKLEEKVYIYLQEPHVFGYGMHKNGRLWPSPRVYSPQGGFIPFQVCQVSIEFKRKVEAALHDKSIPKPPVVSSEIPQANTDHLSTATLLAIDEMITPTLKNLYSELQYNPIFVYLALRGVLTGELNLIEESPLEKAVTIIAQCRELRYNYLDSSNTQVLKAIFPKIHPDFIQTAVQSILLQILENLGSGIVNFHNFNPQRHIPKNAWDKLEFFIDYQSLRDVKSCFDEILHQGLYHPSAKHHLSFIEKLSNFIIHLGRVLGYYLGIGHHTKIMNRLKSYEPEKLEILSQSLFHPPSSQTTMAKISNYVQFHS